MTFNKCPECGGKIEDSEMIFKPPIVLYFQSDLIPEKTAQDVSPKDTKDVTETKRTGAKVCLKCNIVSFKME